jgi:hypothetical protein
MLNAIMSVIDLYVVVVVVSIFNIMLRYKIYVTSVVYLV